MEKTLLIITPGTDKRTEGIFYLVVAETGEWLASHLCSNYTYAKSDLYSGRPERIEDFKNRFGEVEVKFIDQTDISEDELYKRNQEWSENNESES